MMKDMVSRRYFLAGIVGLGLMSFFVLPSSVFAASLDFSPAAKTVSVGQTFSVDVTVSSPDQTMNAASGDVSFPTGKLQVLSVLKTNSIINLWMSDPSFSNNVNGGDINFQGVVLNPGFSGSAGTVIQIVFRAVGEGDAPVSFSDGSVLANDGNGTNILDSLGTADFTVVPAAVVAQPSSSVAQPPASASTSTQQPSVATTTAPVAVNQLYSTSTGTPNSLFSSLVSLLLLLLLLILISLWYLTHVIREHANPNVARKRKELRDDLKRIEKELEADKAGSKIDLSAAGLRKKQESVRREIEHLEEDIKKDTKESE